MKYIIKLLGKSILNYIIVKNIKKILNSFRIKVFCTLYENLYFVDIMYGKMNTYVKYLIPDLFFKIILKCHFPAPCKTAYVTEIGYHIKLHNVEIKF